jgi:16S rRNA (adenine1518-N6/adenine1519-N6)-dimethyltransferase
MMQHESLLTQTKKLLANYDLHARKGLGQNFLIDGGTLNKIAVAAELIPTDTVIEVGPGLGVLTEATEVQDPVLRVLSP